MESLVFLIHVLRITDLVGEARMQCVDMSLSRQLLNVCVCVCVRFGWGWQHEYTLKLHLVRTLSGLSGGTTGKQEIRRVGGISALVTVLERDCMEANGLDADITIATTDVLWRLSFDHVRTLPPSSSCYLNLLPR
jgi:hypothetical protein